MCRHGCRSGRGRRCGVRAHVHVFVDADVGEDVRGNVDVDVNVNVNCDVAQAEDVDVGADGGVNGDVDVNVDANVDVDACVRMCSGWRWSWGCGLGWRCRYGGTGTDTAHGHGARAKAQVQFTAKRLRSFTHIAAQSHAVAVTSALSNDGARPQEKTPGCESNQACLNADAGRGATQLKNHAKEDDFNGRRRPTCRCWRTACSVDFSVQEAGGCPLKAARRNILKPRGFVSLGTCRRTACERDCRGGGCLLCRRPVLAHLKVAHRNTACVVQAVCPYFLRFHTLSSIHDVFITHTPSD